MIIKFLRTLSCIIVLAHFAGGFASASSIARIPGVIGKTSDGRATFTVPEGEHHGTFTIARDIKGLAYYPDAHIIAYDAAIDGSTIDFQRFEWERLQDFIMSEGDLLLHWELPTRFAKREITGAALTKLPSVVTNAPPPVSGVAQRLTVHVGAELHSYQIRYYEFRSSSAAAMFADRWSANKGVRRDSTEHFRRSFDKYGVWIQNADDERVSPDYWIGRFILESLSRKALIALDTSVIYNKKNADVVVFSTDPDTVGPGDRMVLIGQGFSPFLQGNAVYINDKTPKVVDIISSTSHQITIDLPKDISLTAPVQDLIMNVIVGKYAASNPVTVHVRKP